MENIPANASLYFVLVNFGLEKTKQFLKSRPHYPINNVDKKCGQTALHGAVLRNDNGESLRFLLSCPEIDVNVFDVNRHTREKMRTPLHDACIRASNPSIPEILSIILQDKRFNVNILTRDNETCLWLACNNQNVFAVKAMISFREASELNTKHSAMYGFSSYTVLEIAKLFSNEIYKLLMEFDEDPVKTKKKCRQELGLVD